MNNRLLGELIKAGDLDTCTSIVSTLENNRGNMRDTARALGVPERTLYRWCAGDTLRRRVDGVRKGRG